MIRRSLQLVPGILGITEETPADECTLDRIETGIAALLQAVEEFAGSRSKEGFVGFAKKKIREAIAMPAPAEGHELMGVRPLPIPPPAAAACYELAAATAAG